MLVAAIVICEVLFWVVLASGLLARYVWRRPGLGGALLAMAPVVDLVLLVATVLDLRRGGVSTAAHALAAVYLGVSVGFGQSMVRWADARFAHRWGGGPEPARTPRFGREHAAHERRGWMRHALAWAVGCGLLMTAVLVIGSGARTEALSATAGVWTVALAVDAVISFSYTFFPRRPPHGGGGQMLVAEGAGAASGSDAAGTERRARL